MAEHGAEPRRDVQLAFALGFLGTLAFLCGRHYLPFQDLPNHQQVLAIARSLRHAGANDLFERPQFLVWGYSLYVALDGLAARWFSPVQTSTAMIVIAALGLPLAAAWLARAVRHSPWAAALLALPFALGWPVRMGLLPYVLALVPMVALLAPAVRICEAPPGVSRVRQVLVFGALAAVCYLTHALVFGFGLVFVGLAWLVMARGRLRALASLAVGLVPALAMAALDLAHGAFAQVPGTEVTWHVRRHVFRPLKLAFAQIVTRSFGISSKSWLWFYVPALLAIVLCAALAIWRGPAPENRRARVFLLLAGVLGTVGSVAVPEVIGLAFLVGQRIPVLGMVFLCVLGAGALGALPWLVRLSVALAIGLALFGSATGVRQQARRIDAILAHGRLHQLAGRYSTAYVNDCPKPDPPWAWGYTNPEWHLSAYALSDQGATPYLFAYSRYLPVWYRSQAYTERLIGPPDAAANSPWSLPGRELCMAMNRFRIVQALLHPSRFDGVILWGMPAALDQTLAQLRVPFGRFERIADGMMVLLRDGG